jgi:hypothetical protein
MQQYVDSSSVTIAVEGALWQMPDYLANPLQ